MTPNKIIPVVSVLESRCVLYNSVHTYDTLFIHTYTLTLCLPNEVMHCNVLCLPANVCMCEWGEGGVLQHRGLWEMQLTTQLKAWWVRPLPGTFWTLQVRYINRRLLRFLLRCVFCAYLLFHAIFLFSSSLFSFSVTKCDC